MTKLNFLITCYGYAIEPSIALECKEVVQAIIQNDIDALCIALQNNF